MAWMTGKDSGYRSRKSGSGIKRFMTAKDAGFRSRKPATTLKKRRANR